MSYETSDGVNFDPYQEWAFEFGILHGLLDGANHDQFEVPHNPFAALPYNPYEVPSDFFLTTPAIPLSGHYHVSGTDGIYNPELFGDIP